MAQIKKIVKPGDLIRGAKVGVAGLDKDGNVIGTGIDTEDIATWPEGAQSGDVLAWGETGPEWAPPTGGGGSVFNHFITINSDVLIHLVTDSSTPFTRETLKAYLVKLKNDNHINPYSYYRLSGIGSYGTAPYCPVVRIEFGGVGSNDGLISITKINYSIVDGTLSSSTSSVNISFNSSMSISDIVG